MGEIIRNMPAATYHAESFGGPIRLSGSIAHKLVSQSPLHAWQAHPRLGGRAEEPTDATELGSAIHDLILGGGREWAIIDAPDYRTKAAKEARDLALVEGKMPVIKHKAESWTALGGIVKGKLRDAGIDISGCETELTVLWEDGSVACRGRVDAFDAATGWVTDLKTCKNASPRAVLGSVLAYGYDLKAAAYLEGLEAAGHPMCSFRFAFVETEAPWATCVVELADEFAELGRRKWARAKEVWRRCHGSGIWPGYGQLVLSPPAWAMAQDLEQQITAASSEIPDWLTE